MNRTAQFRSFAEFYPYYLGEHSNPTCRRLHFVGTSLVIALLAYTIGSGKWLLLLAVPLSPCSRWRCSPVSPALAGNA